jgi:DNA-binding transcriptional MerR regulator
MVGSTSARWTIAELGARAAEALSVDYRGPENGQIRAIPNQRTIRYYTTLGLLDRPVEMHGRTAYYGPRHLMQLVAIKRLQEAGRSLDEVQRELAGLPDGALEEIARIPAAISGSEAAAESEATLEPSSPSSPGRRAQRFWAAAPAPLLSAASECASDATVSTATAACPPRRDGVRALAEDVSAVRAAAAGLVDELVARGLARRAIEGSGPGEDEPGGSR